MAQHQHNGEADIHWRHRRKISDKNSTTDTWRARLWLHQSTKSTHVRQRRNYHHQTWRQGTWPRHPHHEGDPICDIISNSVCNPQWATDYTRRTINRDQCVPTATPRSTCGRTPNIHHSRQTGRHTEDPIAGCSWRAICKRITQLLHRIYGGNDTRSTRSSHGSIRQHHGLRSQSKRSTHQ